MFLRMSDAPDLYLNDVLHRASIEVTEEGTIAAAATAVIMKQRSMPRPPTPMRFDRPFVMLVVHRPTAVPLFVGRFNHPEFDV